MALSGTASTSGRAWRQCLQTPASPRPLRNRLRCQAAYQTEASIPPPPPPPPPPPSGQGVSRRGVLQRFGGLAATAALGGLVGYLLGSRSGGGAEGGLSAAERADVDELRRELHFRRDYDGHVFVRDGRGGWWEIKVDGKLPGTLLLRDPQDSVFFITFNDLQQIDLSDDYIIGSLFAGGDWEGLLQAVQARDETGVTQDVRLDKDAFRNMVSVTM